MVGTRVWDRIKGWGNIIDETEHLFIVRWDSDPWHPEEIIKKEHREEYMEINFY